MGRLWLPARRTSNPAKRRVSPCFGGALQVRGRLVDGIVDVVAAASQRQVDGADWEAYPCPLSLGDGNVGARRQICSPWTLPVEVRVPRHADGERPKGSEDAIDGVIFAITFSQGRLTRLVVDERQPASGQDGERRERQDLGDDLEDVDERLSSGEVVEEPLGHLAMVVEGRVAQPEDETPAIVAASRGCSPLVVHVARLDAALAVQEEGVRVEHCGRCGGLIEGISLARRFASMATSALRAARKP